MVIFEVDPDGKLFLSCGVRFIMEYKPGKANVSGQLSCAGRTSCHLTTLCLQGIVKVKEGLEHDPQAPTCLVDVAKTRRW